MPDDKKEFEKAAVSGSLLANLALGSAATGVAGMDEAAKTRKRLDRLKAKVGVPGQKVTPAAVHEKTAGVGAALKGAAGAVRSDPIGQGLIVALLGGAGVALTGELMRGAGGAAGAMMSSMKKKQLFNRIMQKNPEFRQTEAKRDLAEKYFNLIMNYAPALSRDETAITDFMRRQLMYQTSSVEFIKQLADLEAMVRGKVDPHSTHARVSGSATRTMENYLGSALARSYPGG